MTLRNSRELANTQRTLAMLERLIESSMAKAEPGQVTELRSLGQVARELREEIIWDRMAAGTYRTDAAHPSSPLSRK
jgi:hypothetical protein